MFIPSIQKKVPPHLHPTYLISGQNLEYVREPMGLTNSKVGYVYLVDEKVRIRWAGCGDAMRDEAQALLDCTAMLLQRLKENTPGFQKY
jgi:ATPase complex subunit ATP10